MRISYHSVHEPVCGICRKHCRSFESLREHLIGNLLLINCKQSNIKNLVRRVLLSTNVLLGSNYRIVSVEDTCGLQIKNQSINFASHCDLTHTREEREIRYMMSNMIEKEENCL